MFTPRRILKIDLPDGAVLHFHEPLLEDIRSELGFASLPPGTALIAKETLYNELVVKIDPATSVYNLESKERKAAKHPGLIKDTFTLCLAQALVAPSPSTIGEVTPKNVSEFVDTVWCLGDSDLAEKGKTLYTQLPSDISIVKLTGQLEGCKPDAFLETLKELFLVSTSPEMSNPVKVSKFVAANGELLGIYYQQLIGIAASFFQSFPKVARKF